tara:strand:+ start:296 stop:577 length:282 start_codon:yes stop_codon:yes gene_type:complete
LHPQKEVELAMGKHDKTREQINQKPTSSKIKWTSFRSFMLSLGFIEIQGSGSRVKFYNKEKDALAHFHKPHPKPEMDKAAVDDAREFLIAHGL